MNSVRIDENKVRVKIKTKSERDAKALIDVLAHSEHIVDVVDNDCIECSIKIPLELIIGGEAEVEFIDVRYEVYREGKDVVAEVIRILHPPDIGLMERHLKCAYDQALETIKSLIIQEKLKLNEGSFRLPKASVKIAKISRVVKKVAKVLDAIGAWANVSRNFKNTRYPTSKGWSNRRKTAKQNKKKTDERNRRNVELEERRKWV